MIKLIRPIEVENSIKEDREKDKINAHIRAKGNKRIPCKSCGFYFLPSKNDHWNSVGYCSENHVPGRNKRSRMRKTKENSAALNNNFYESKKWRGLRYATIKKYGRRCMVCFTESGEMHVDHIKPISKYPELALISTNLQIMCKNCNLGKSNSDEIDWRPKCDSK